MISFSADHLSSEVLAELVQLLLRNCTRLEALALVHGIKYTSRSGTIPDFPRLGSSFSRIQLLQSLRGGGGGGGGVKLGESLHTLVVDEALMAPGQLAERGVKGMGALHKLAEQAKLPYDFTYFSVDFPLDVTLVSVSSSASSMLPLKCTVPLIECCSRVTSPR